MINKEWYSQPMVLWNIFITGFGGETSISAKPYDTAQEAYHKKAILIPHINYAKALLANDDYEVTDLYTSLPKYDLTGQIGAKRIENKDFFANEPLYWIMAFDFDSHEDPIEALPSLINAWEWLAQVYPKVKWSIKFSGGKGWHLESDLKQPYLKGMDANRILADSLKLAGKAPAIDTVIYSPRREWRCPWSIHHNGFVAMPFSMQELVEFVAHYPDSKKGLEPGEVMQRYPINNQGFKWITTDHQFWFHMGQLKQAAKT